MCMFPGTWTLKLAYKLVNSSCAYYIVLAPLTKAYIQINKERVKPQEDQCFLTAYPGPRPESNNNNNKKSVVWPVHRRYTPKLTLECFCKKSGKMLQRWSTLIERCQTQKVPQQSISSGVCTLMQLGGCLFSRFFWSPKKFLIVFRFICVLWNFILKVGNVLGI